MPALRLHILASQLGLSDDEVQELCASLGIAADAPSTLISEANVRKVKRKIAHAKKELVEEEERKKREEEERKKAEAEKKKREREEKKRKEAEARKEAARKKKEEAARKKADAERKKREREEKKRLEEEKKKREEEERKREEENKKREEARRQAEEEIRKREEAERKKREEEERKREEERLKAEEARRKAEEKVREEKLAKIKESLKIIELNKLVTLKTLAPKFGMSPKDMTDKLEGLGLKATQSERLDKDTVLIFAQEIGYDVVFTGNLGTPEDEAKAADLEAKAVQILETQEREAKEAASRKEAKKGKSTPAPDRRSRAAVAAKEEEPVEEKSPLDVLMEEEPDDPKDLKPRAPIVTVMGHVDHGKTSILDYIRKTKVASREKGGITQHIGAYKIVHSGRDIVFIDTPGHAAFTQMRARGAQVTDLVVLVIAADDGIMPQTIEAINHAKSAKVPIIVAVNKIDKPNANVAQAKQQLMQYDLLPEEWGGQTIVCDVSAVEGTGIDHLLEMINLQAEIMELKGNPKAKTRCVVIESQVSKGRGAVATVIVKKGTLKVGDIVISGKSYGKVKALSDETGKRVKEATPSTPVEVMGLSEPPAAGEIMYGVDNEKFAREVAAYVEEKQRVASASRTTAPTFSLEDFLAEPAGEEAKELKIVLKGDVQGSIEALTGSLADLSTEKAKVNILHSAVGPVGESDVMLANASGAVIIAFSVRADSNAADLADREGVTIYYYDIIYRALEEIRAVLEGMLEPVFNEAVVGEAEVREIFRSSSLGTIAGCQVRNGYVARNLNVHLVRNGERVWSGEIASLYRFKDEVREVKSGLECGVRLRGFQGVEAGDVLEAYKLERVAQTL